MELFSEKLLLALRLFAKSFIDSNQLREYLAERFFSNAPERPLDHLLLGEIEIALAEYERGDRDLADVQELAANLSRKAILIAQQLGAIKGQEPILALA